MSLYAGGQGGGWGTGSNGAAGILCRGHKAPRRERPSWVPRKGLGRVIRARWRDILSLVVLRHQAPPKVACGGGGRCHAGASQPASCTCDPTECFRQRALDWGGLANVNRHGLSRAVTGCHGLSRGLLGG